MIKIDKAKALELLERAVAERGENYRVAQCLYFYQGVPCCIVGHALSYVGVTTEKFGTDPSDNSIYGQNGLPIEDIWGPEFEQNLGVELTPGAFAVFKNAQEIQDGRYDGGRDDNWGEALESAREIAREVGE